MDKVDISSKDPKKPIVLDDNTYALVQALDRLSMALEALRIR